MEGVVAGVEVVDGDLDNTVRLLKTTVLLFTLSERNILQTDHFLIKQQYLKKLCSD